MLLTLDIGNTQTAGGLFDGDELVGDWRTDTAAKRTPDELAVLWSRLLELRGRRLEDITGVCLASVVPMAGTAMGKMIGRHTGARLLAVEPGIETGLTITYEHPENVGADRIANAAAGSELIDGAFIVVDFGTATTFDVVSAEGAYMGGVIAPGIITGADALVLAAAGLGGVSLETPDCYIGRNTAASLRSGIIFGTAAMVDGVIAGIRRELGFVCPVIGTGGLVDMVGQFCRTIDTIEPLLTLQGLKRIWKLNLP